MSIYGSLFGGGRWEWDEEKKGITFVSLAKATKKKKSEKEQGAAEKAASRRANLELRFVDALDPKEMATFRHMFMRHARLTEMDVVTLQDVRDVVLFQCVNNLPLDLVDLLHTESVDRFLRALLVYLQQYIKIVDQLHRRQSERAGKLTLGELTPLELTWQRELSDLRTLLAREHCSLLLAADRGMERFHHLAAGKGGVTSSQAERDIRCYEMLWRISARMVYIALERPSASLIEGEMNRLFRSPVFTGNVGSVTRNAFGKIPKGETPPSSGSTIHFRLLEDYQKLVLHGPPVVEHNKFLTHSPAAHSVLGDVDYRLMATGQVEFHSNDERLDLLWKAVTLPAELLGAYDIVIGILGRPRCDYDPMLAPVQKEEDTEQGAEPLAELVLETEKEEEPPAKPGLELPEPGPRVPAPSAFPQGRWTPPEESAAFLKMRAEDRELARRRWRRWFLMGSRRHGRQRGDSQTTPLAEGELAVDASAIALGELALATAAAVAMAEE